MDVVWADNGRHPGRHLPVHAAERHGDGHLDRHVADGLHASLAVFLTVVGILAAVAILAGFARGGDFDGFDQGLGHGRLEAGQLLG